MSYLEDLANKYYRDLASPRRQSTGPSNYDIFNATPRPLGPDAFVNRVEGAIGGQSTLGRIIDVLSRPAYAVGNVIKESITEPLTDVITGERNSTALQSHDRGDNPINTAFNSTFGAMLSGLSGRSKTMPSHVLERWEPQSGAEGVGKFATGLALDIALDPTTYIGAGAIRQAAKSVPGVAHLVQSLRSSGNIAKATSPEATNAVVRNTTTVAKDSTDLKNLFEQFVPQESLRQAANKPYTAAWDASGAPLPAGQIRRAYPELDLNKLPSLYEVPKPPAPTKKMTITQWAKTFADSPVALTDDAVRFASATEDGVTDTLKSLITKGQATKDTDLMSRITALYNESQSAVATGTRKSAASAPEAAQRAALASQQAPRAVRIQGAARAQVLKALKDRLDPEDYLTLVRTRSSESFDKARREILSRAHSPVRYSSPIDAPSESYLRRLLGEATDNPSGRVLNPATPDVAAALENATKRQLRPENFNYRTTLKKTARDKQQYGVGRGISDRAFNARAQYTLFADLIRRVSAPIKATKLQNEARALVVKKRLMSYMDEAENVLRSRGIEPILGDGFEGVAVSLLDILRSIDSTAAGNKFLLNHFFNLKENVAPSALMSAVESIIVAMREVGVSSVDDIADFAKMLAAGKNTEGSLYDLLGYVILGEVRGSHAPAAAKNVVKGVTSTTAKRVWDKEAKHGDWVQTTTNMGGKRGSEIVNVTRNILTDRRVLTALFKANAENSARYGLRMGQEVQRISDEVVSEFFNTWLKPTTSTGEAIAIYKGRERAALAAAKSINAMESSKDAAVDVIKSEIDDALALDLPVIQHIDNIANATDDASAHAAAQALHDDIAREVAEETPTHAVVDAAEFQGINQDIQIIRGMFPFLTKSPGSLLGRLGTGTDHVLSKFYSAAGHATIRGALTSQGSVVRNLANGWRAALTDVHRAFPNPEALQPIFVQLQKGEAVVGEFTAAQQQAVDKLTELTKMLFETNTERGVKGATGVFFRNAADVEHINARMAQSKLPESIAFDLDAAVTTAKKEGITVRNALANQWRTWKVEDPIDFMARMQHVATSVLADTAIARDAARIAKSKGLMSMSKREGFVKLVDSSDSSVLIRYLPEGAWWHKDIVDEIRAMDAALSQSFNFASPFGQWVNRYIDPFLQAWKAGMTIYRPGHHVRNLIGDSSLSFLADGVPKVHQIDNARKVMLLRGNYDGWSALRSLQGMGPDAGKIVSEATLLRGESIAAHVSVGGKKTTVTAKQVHDYMRSRGVLPDFVSGEDLLQSADESSQSIRAIQEAMGIFGGRVRNAAGRVSEARDDFVRISHFLQIIEKESKFKSVDELMEYAAARVRKWHPDGTDLTAQESKYMRRIFPFYSWTRKSIPLVVEAMVMHPGRIMLWPKASYNAALAAGIDINSISDPFPEDQLFPSFLTDEMTGPVADINGNYYNFNPGLANVDIMNQFIGDPWAGVTGMLSPFIKVPAELATGSRIDTHSNISDTSEYLGSNIPGITHLQRATGTDIIGALLGQGMNPIFSVKKGNRDSLDMPTLINLLTGMGIQNMSQPSYINYAEIEMRNRARREAG